MQQDGRTGVLVVGEERSRGYLGRRIDRAWCWLVCGEKGCRNIKRPGFRLEIQDDRGATVRGGDPGEKPIRSGRRSELGSDPPSLGLVGHLC